mmetsp:Transcript_69063/g.191261  ORF Transcript_69063/g.191261 Transcript_69063/m.191261 type:complete len:293 (+) Transcript_69063:392-1270(+)
MLRLPEQRSSVGQARMSLLDVSNPQFTEDRIILEGVSLHIPDREDGAGFGPLDGLLQKPGTRIEIPLGKVVFVRGSTEAKRLSFLALVAELLPPNSGEVRVPPTESSAMMPAVPIGMPFRSIRDSLVTCGASPEVATNFANLLGLPAGETSERLSLGKSIMASLAKYLLWDPAVLLAVRPYSSAPPELQGEILDLLVAWQAGGGGRMLRRMLEKQGLAECAESFNGLPPGGRARRTLILSCEAVPAHLPPESVHVLDLDAYLIDSDAGVDDETLDASFVDCGRSEPRSERSL